MQGSERLGRGSKEEGDTLGFFRHQGGGKTGVRTEIFGGRGKEGYVRQCHRMDWCCTNDAGEDGLSKGGS